MLVLVFFLPLFFIPGEALALPAAKASLASVGILIACLFFLYEVWREGRVVFPKHYLIVVAALLPVVYLLSAILATPTTLSLLGYNLEQGTFGFILLGSALLLLASVIFSDSSRILQALTVFFVSFSIVALFAAAKIIVGGDFLAVGQFFSNMGNTLGAWTDLAMAFGLLAVFSALTLGMLPLALSARVLLYIVFALSTVLLVVVNFSTAFALTLGAALLLWLYFAKIEKAFLHTKGEGGARGKTILPIILAVISLLFFINPTISESRGNLGNIVSRAFGVENTDVRPSLSATLGISKQVLSLSSLLGSGPNTFGQDWLIYKPANINATPFWSLAFPYGVGFLPTQIATTGILGSAFWLAFVVFLLALSIRALGHIPESRASRFTLVSTMLLSLFLWISTLFYTPSASILLLTFFFAGLFAAASRDIGAVSSKVIELGNTPQHRVAAALIIGALSLGSIWFLWLSGEKTVAAYHFQKAVALSNTPDTALTDIEVALTRAVQISPDDRSYSALSRLNFSVAQTVANSETGTPEQNQAMFQQALSNSIQYARAAVAANPASYDNWIALGLIYSALVPKPLEVEGSYENAIHAFNEASKRNPNNPELPLLLAQLELSKENVAQARSHILSALALKNDYADAYLALAQLEIAQGNTTEAIASTEQLAILMPDNAGVFFEIGFLKYSNEDFDGAVESFRQALVLSSDYANAKYYLALSLQELGEIDEARMQLEELLVTNPDNAELKAALSGLED